MESISCIEAGGIRAARLGEMVEEGIAHAGKASRILVIPPDATRSHSFAGIITEHIWRKFSHSVRCVLPALGTHHPMTGEATGTMFGQVPASLFAVHDWKNGAVRAGWIEADEMAAISGGRLSEPLPIDLASELFQGDYDLVVSVGQVVPHEVAGFSGHAKNIIVGTGGAAIIDMSHWLSALVGIDTILGWRDNPVRSLFDRAAEKFLGQLHILHILTVVETPADCSPRLVGVFAGTDRQCFEDATVLASKVNIHAIGRKASRVVVSLEGCNYSSTWLCNKAIYRTRQMIAQGGELVILAPDLRSFGEADAIDAIIRSFGYRSSAQIIAQVNAPGELSKNLCAAAHLVHGATDGAFRVRYCPGYLSQAEIEGAGFLYGNLEEARTRYAACAPGWNTVDAEEVYFIRDPGMGLWRK